MCSEVRLKSTVQFGTRRVFYQKMQGINTIRGSKLLPLLGTEGSGKIRLPESQFVALLIKRQQLMLVISYLGEISVCLFEDVSID